ncbi:MAG: Wzt carbohydrate-binding domain-containing protein, partial [Bryobacteraceae bacterium]|nr:Wzt carbohydrate-binding domain-containing protein [Bryobacteraceae bacterium]
IEDIQILNSTGHPTTALLRGDRTTVRIRARFHQPSKNPIAGLLIRNRLGIDVYGTNTRIEQIALGEYSPGDLLELDFVFDCWLVRHEYTLTVAMQHADGASQDWLDDAVSFSVADPKEIAGLVDLKAEIRFRNPAS